MYFYTNLSDSVHYNQETSYTPKEGKQFFNYASALKEEFKSIYSSSDDKIAFTLNQIADNPVFFQDTKDTEINQISEALFNLLMKLFWEKKAFLSTYNDYTVKSYAMNRMLSSWKRICDDQTDDVRFVSSMVEELARIKGKPDPERENIVHFSDNERRRAHKAIFGIDRLTRISGGNVTYGNRCLPVPEYIEQTVQKCMSEKKNGWYIDLYRSTKSSDSKDESIFLKRLKRLTGVIRIQSSDGFGCYRPNDPFVNDNAINLGTVMQSLIKKDELFRRIYRETIDSALEKRIRRDEDNFLTVARDVFLELSSIEKPSRSKMYELGYPRIDEFLIPNMRYGDNNVKKNAILTYAMSFFFQVIDFCYNYYNYLLSYGVQEGTQFVFYPYNTSQDKESDKLLQGFRKNSIDGKIELTNDLFREKTNYRLVDKDEITVGSFIKLDSAITAKGKRERETPDKQFYIVDREGAKLPI